jgi:peptidoglycan/LPS O-acetylase OafA/YrhL
MATDNRLHALDAVRAFALFLGVVFHAGFSFIPGMIPGIWAIVDTSPSTSLSVTLFTAHIFRMSLFFFIAGFFARALVQRGGAPAFWTNRFKRILLPLIAGWIVVFPAIAVVWIWGLTKTFGSTLPPPPAEMPPSPPGAFPLTHLWFLYYLLVLYAAVLLGRAIVLALDRNGSIRRATDSMVRGLVQTGAAAVVVALPATLGLYFRADWIAWFGIPTPDRSVIPELASLAAYGTALAIGWLIHRQVDLLAAWARQWPFHLTGALTGTVACLWMTGVTPTLAPAAPGGEKLAVAFCYSVAIWCWSFALLGLATRFLSHANSSIRYAADASYWIYIVHLPVVVALQVAVGHLPWDWTIKFPLILIASLVVLFASYRYLVRSTFIGQMLNGRRYPRAEPTQECSTATAIMAVRRRDPRVHPRHRPAPPPCRPPARRPRTSRRLPASTSDMATRLRSQASILMSGGGSCSRCSDPTARESPRQFRYGLDCSSPTRVQCGCSAALRSTSRAAAMSAS